MTLSQIYASNKKTIDNMGLYFLDPEIKTQVFLHLQNHRVFNDHLINPGNWKRVWGNIIALLEHKQFILNIQLPIAKNPDLNIATENIIVTTDSNNYSQSDIYDKLPNIQNQQFQKQTVLKIDQYQMASQLEQFNFDDVYEYVQQNLSWNNKPYWGVSLITFKKSETKDNITIHAPINLQKYDNYYKDNIDEFIEFLEAVDFFEYQGKISKIIKEELTVFNDDGTSDDILSYAISSYDVDSGAPIEINIPIEVIPSKILIIKE